jgi:hypothetical protein
MEAEKENLIQNENNDDILNLNKINNKNNISKDNSNESKEEGKEEGKENKDITNK